MTALTNTERQEAYRLKMRIDGYRMIHGIYAPLDEDLRDAIRVAAQKLINQYNKERAVNDHS